MTSIFEQLLHLYERSEVHTNIPIEDFTTEILAGVLRSNQSMLDGFVNTVLKIPGDGYQVVTQKFYPLKDDSNCRVDMVFFSENQICFMENKVDTTAGSDQLERYEKVLGNLSAEGKFEETFLRYCTKKYESNEKEQNFSVDFLMFRWKDVYDYFIVHRQDSLVNAFLLFLERKKLMRLDQLSHMDLTVMKNVQETLQKLGEWMEPVSLEFIKRFGEPTVKPGSQGLKEVAEHNRYIISRKKAFSTGISELMAGINFNESDGPALFIQLWCNRNNSKFEEYQKHILERESFFQKVVETDRGIRARMTSPLSKYIGERNQTKEMQFWFCEHLDRIEDFILETSNLDWNLTIPRKVVGQQDESRLLLQLGSGRGQILDLYSKVVNPAMNIDAILKFGYWEECEKEYDLEVLMRDVIQIGALVR